MENYISRNMYKRKIKINCGQSGQYYTGIVEMVTGKVLVLEQEDNTKNYIAIDKIINFVELE